MSEGMSGRVVRASKFLALVLRHDPARAGLTLDPHGWADVAALLDGVRAAGVPLTPELLAQVVDTNDKRRYELSDDGRRIRASQGHSVDVDLQLPRAVPPETLYHGTASRLLPAILAEGLRPGSRRHVHLSPDVPTAVSVGSRHGRPVVLAVRAGDLHRGGHVFHVAANGVWLTASVPPAYLSPHA